MTWNHTGSGISGSVAALAASPLTSGLFYAGTTQGLYKSTDGGATWTRTGSFTQVRAICIDETNDSLVYVGTGTGVYYTTDGGATWQQLNTGLTNTDILSLALQPGPSGLLFAGTNGAGVFSHLPPTGVSHSLPAPVSANCKLRTFPNPCRNRLTITLETSPLQDSPLSSGAVAGAIYDKLGQLIWELTPEPVRSGKISWEIDLRTVSSGVYFLKIQTPNRTITRRITVVR